MSDPVLDIFQQAAGVVAEIQANGRTLPAALSVNDCFDQLEVSLRQLSAEPDLAEKMFRTIEALIEKARHATRTSSEIVKRISKCQTRTTEDWTHESKIVKDANYEHDQLITELELQCLELEKTLENKRQSARKEVDRIKQEIEAQTAQLRANHDKNLALLQESFNLAMRQIEDSKDHTMCHLRLKSLETKGNDTLRRLDAEIETVRDQMRKAKKLAKETERQSSMSGKRKARIKASERGETRSENHTTLSAESSKSLIDTSASQARAVAKKPRRRLYKEEDEIGEQSDVPNLLLEDEKLDLYLQGLRELVSDYKSRRKENVDAAQKS